MAEVSTTTAATWVQNNWDPIDVAATEESIFAELISQRRKSQGQLTIPYMSNVTALAATAGSMSGQSLTYAAATEGSATLSPSAYYAAQEVDLPLIMRAVQDPEQAIQENLSASIASIIDYTALSRVALLAGNIVNAAGGIDKASFLSAIKLGATGAKRYWRPGGTGPFCCLHVSQVDSFLNISDFMSAQIRGDRMNPIATGWAATVAGVDVYESGNVYTSGGTAYNVMCIPRAFGMSYNQRPKVLLQEFGLVVRIICWTDFSTNIVRDAYAVQINSPST
jgi:hypothetical protein